MARLEKRRMTESANNSTTSTGRSSVANIVNGLSSNNEIENLLFKQEQDGNPQFAVSIPENILLNHSLPTYVSPTSSKRPRASSDLFGATINGQLSPNKKSRLNMSNEDGKLSPGAQAGSSKVTKKNRNKQQQGANQPQTIVKTAASGIFPQQPISLQHNEESADNVSPRFAHE
jgi:hypothetical protein